LFVTVPDTFHPPFTGHPGKYEVAFGRTNPGHNLETFADTTGAKWYDNWDGPAWDYSDGAGRQNNLNVLGEMEKADAIHFHTNGLVGPDAGILDGAFQRSTGGNSILEITGTQTEIAMALEWADIDTNAPLISKVLFHDEFGRVMSASEFIRHELAAGLVTNPEARDWLNAILSNLN